ncbi:hypothetical protein [Streptomyces resistomycificus]|uniref:hypothetical protein n=1 Tax=Streptomyces resistomycificus TaxID=67356 RepID=UPI001CECDC30|nr:hypothetical protein [Streptomyces resistomycificus]
MFQTAYGSLATGLGLQAVQTLLICGGTSVVGLSATTIARDRFATVLSTTRSPDRAGETAGRGCSASHRRRAAQGPVASVYHGLEQVRDTQADVEAGTTLGMHVALLDD